MSFKKFFIIFFSFFFFLSGLPIFAADSPTTDSNSEIVKLFKNFTQINGAAQPGKTAQERWVEDFNISQAMSGFRMLFGDPTDIFAQITKYFLSNGKEPFPRFVVGGALGTGTNMIGMLYTPAASGVEYIAQSWGNVLGKPAYAQSPNGFGFQGLQFILPIWKAFRNVIYVISSIIFVVIGLMIILRVKVSPQAVVTVQSAIPAVITTLILITFSYAIAGFIIDLTNIIGGIFMAIIFNIQGLNINTGALTPVPGISSNFTNSTGSIGQLDYKNMVNPGFGNLASLMMASAPKSWTLMMISSQIGGVIVGMLLGGLLNPFGVFPIAYSVGDAVGQVLGGLLGFIFIPFIIGIVIAFWIIKMFFGMLTNYVTIIFKIITAPLEIGMGAFPNSKIGFSTWFMDVLANAMVFPIITIFFAILNTISQSIYNSSATIWAPGPISTTMIANADNTIPASVLSALISLAGLAMASNLPSLIPQFIFMIKPSPFGDAIGKNLKDIETGLKHVSQTMIHDPMARTNNGMGNPASHAMEILGLARAIH